MKRRTALVALALVTATLAPTLASGDVAEAAGDRTFYMRNSNSAGGSDLTSAAWGKPGDIPLSGDWDGNGIDSIGIFRPSTRTFYVSNEVKKPVTVKSAVFGSLGDVPLAGDWDNDGKDTIGVYRPSTRTFHLRNAIGGGVADKTAVFGAFGDVPVVGDWNGNGSDTIGVWRPSTQEFHLRNDNKPGPAEIVAKYGAPTDLPIAGNWDGVGGDSIGIFRPSTREFKLRNTNTPGGSDISTASYGAIGDVPVVGDWNNDRVTTIGVYRPNLTAAAVLTTGSSLACDRSISSPNRIYKLTLRCSDGHGGHLLVTDKGDQPVFASFTPGSGAVMVTLRTDGKLWLTTSSGGNVAWPTAIVAQPSGGAGKSMRVQDDGNLVMGTWNSGSSDNCDADELCLYNDKAPGKRPAVLNLKGRDLTMESYEGWKFHDGVGIDNQVGSIVNKTKVRICFYTQPGFGPDETKICADPGQSLPDVEAKNITSHKAIINIAPFVCPVNGYTWFGDDFGNPRPGHTHQGTDMGAARGTPAVAVKAGTVSFQTDGSGKSAYLRSSDGNTYFYTHLDAWVGGNRTVAAGETIGLVGSTGVSDGFVHLHFEIRPGGAKGIVNPYPYLDLACPGHGHRDV